jgi:hypothetical protein
MPRNAQDINKTSRWKQCHRKESDVFLQRLGRLWHELLDVSFGVSHCLDIIDSWHVFVFSQ